MTKIAELVRTRPHFLSTEFLPPRSPNLSELVRKTLSVASVVDAVSVPELKANANGGVKYRMNPLFASLRLRELTGMETVFHITPRDLNRNAVTGILLSALEAKLQNVLVIGGDRYTPEEHSKLSKNVYDFSGSLELIKWIRSVTVDFDGKEFCIIAGTDPTVIYTKDRARVEREVSRLIERQDAGADVFQTQPIFDLRYFDFIDLAREQGLKRPVLVGVLPLRGKSDSEEVESKFGIAIPREVKSSLCDHDEARAREMALNLGAELASNKVGALHVYPRGDCDFILDFARSVFKLSETTP